jgi:uncharacterized iron-regulated membrane protein
MRKIFRNIHLWLSIPFGILITLICFSGAALVFEKEVMELCHRDLYFVKKVEAAPLPMEQLMTKVAATLPDSVSVTGVNVSSDPERAYQVTLSKPRRASMYVDQYTGEVTGKYERAPFFNFMFRMHRWLLDSMKQDLLGQDDCRYQYANVCVCADIRRFRLVAAYAQGIEEQSEDCSK